MFDNLTLHVWVRTFLMTTQFTGSRYRGNCVLFACLGYYYYDVMYSVVYLNKPLLRTDPDAASLIFRHKSFPLMSYITLIIKCLITCHFKAANWWSKRLVTNHSVHSWRPPCRQQIPSWLAASGIKGIFVLLIKGVLLLKISHITKKIRFGHYNHVKPVLT